MNDTILTPNFNINITSLNLCRLCMSDKNDMLNIFKLSNFVKSFTLTDIMSFCQIEVLENESLPNNICSQCCIIMNNVFEFQKFVQKCDLTLRNSLRDPLLVIERPEVKFNTDITLSIPKVECSVICDQPYVKNNSINNESKDISALPYLKYEETSANENDHNLCKKIKPTTTIAKKTEADNDQLVDTKICRDYDDKVWNEDCSDSDDVLINYVKPKKKTRRRKNQSPNTYECPICLKTFSLRCRMLYHLQIHGEKTEQCPSCDRKFKHKREVIIHMKTHGGSEKYQCEYCALWYSSSANLCKHIRNKHRAERGLPPPEPRQRTHLCHMCPKGFYSATSLNSHLITHRQERNFECPICKKAFISQNYVQKHMAIHNSSQDHECSICFKRFGQAKNLKDHMISHSGLKEFICQICSRAFARKNELKMHMKIHRNEKDIACPKCPMRFTQLGNMRRHLATHRDKQGEDPRPRNHLCHVCSKGFTTKELLTSHLKTHSDVREFACHTCGARFRTKAILQGHVETHSTIKSYVCEVCNKGFTKDKYLKVHVRSHSKERNFDCSKCNRGFATSYLLSLHQKQHEGVFHDYCFPCNKGYMVRSSFDKHLQSKEHLRIIQETNIN